MENNFLIPNYIEALSPSRLRALCLSKCVKDNKQYKFFDFGQYVNARGKVMQICWYYEEFTSEELMRGDATAKFK